MGDARFDDAYEQIANAKDRAAAVKSLRNDEVLHALAAASRKNDPYLANVLTTEALNRYRRLSATFAAITWGALSIVALRTLLIFAFHITPGDWPDSLLFHSMNAALLAGGIIAYLAYRRSREGLRHRA